MAPGCIEITSAEDELSRRRERGRRSQAAFRKRQAQATQVLSDQNRRLIEGVQKAVDAVQGDERQEILDAIANLATIAGVSPKDSPLRDTLTPSEDDDITIDVLASDFTCNTKSSTSTNTQLFNPAPRRLDCGIWLDPLHYRRISLPPQDIIPYLGPGSKTFAGQLFWSVMDHSLNGCKHPHAEASAVVKTGLGHSKATQDVKVSFIRRMVEARLEFRKTGSISPEHASAAENDLGMVLCNLVETDYRARGKDPDLWLSCVAIAQRVKSIAGVPAFVLLERAAQDEGDDDLRDALSHVKCRLSDTGVCFGDGPRWNVDVVDSLFLDPILQAMGRL
ncbi:hypothetical protein CDV31_002697 [Fusarium ambrosium]|uniref:BZIP domain-containing protein n=1 Tax=Fusarium ambrosium TaxID=131363 RepID=A0A428UW80_9HYPO|nr:hypothetical protein CDV31_002697 [Fusarium ambrosium]